MNVVEEIEEKIENYLEIQTSEIQDNFLAGNFELIKQEIEFKVYIAQKIINKGIEIDTDTVILNYISKEDYQLSIDTNIKLSYKNNPFLIVDTNNFNLECFNDEENKYYASLLVALNQNWDDLNHDNQLWFFIPHCEVDNNNLESFVQFILLINGEIFHSPIETEENQFLINDVKNILECNSKKFNQYQESAYILSEYNHTKDILLKYLLLYHIIENFMYRRPIAEMANTKLTIRDFKNLYKKVDLTEEQTLKELLKKIKNENITPTDIVEQYFNNKLSNYKSSLTTQNQINQIFRNMTLQNINGLNYSNASKLIYYFRNSIIHNKETEFHITHTTLNGSLDLVAFFKSFLLPILENIIYFLIFKEDSIIDYPKNHLLLYGEDCEN
ncbi:hypothetical protein KKC13_05095 [bacterium]|nr:hypothetical protein [bacterium]MBU1959405.1 hypothetical protein [bacterium]